MRDFGYQQEQRSWRSASFGGDGARDEPPGGDGCSVTRRDTGPSPQSAGEDAPVPGLVSSASLLISNSISPPSPLACRHPRRPLRGSQPSSHGSDVSHPAPQPWRTANPVRSSPASLPPRPRGPAPTPALRQCETPPNVSPIYPRTA